MIINHYSIICDSTIHNGTQTVIRISFSKNSFNYPHSAVIELKLSSYISYSNSCYLTNSIRVSSSVNASTIVRTFIDSVYDSIPDIVAGGITDANETYDILDFEW